jgi:hypothetical protein
MNGLCLVATQEEEEEEEDPAWEEEDQVGLFMRLLTGKAKNENDVN